MSQEIQQESGPAAARFDDWASRVRELRELFHRLQVIAENADEIIGETRELGAAQRLEKTESVFERETFRIMVVGEFSSGKSTLINAMLGKKLLPTKANPATAFTTLLQWGEAEKARLYRGVERRGSSTVVSIDKFQEEVSLKIDAEGAPREPSFGLAVVSQPLDLLRQSVEIVDSAGINESPERELITLSFLEQVDAVVFVTDAGRPFTLNETKNYLDHVRELGHRDIFFVVNQFDRIGEEDRAEVQSRCRNVVTQFSRASGSSSGTNIFFVSALTALKARISHDGAAERESGILEFEKALELFCQRDIARVKFVRLAEFLRHNVVLLRRRLQGESAMLAKSAEELRAILDRSQGTRDHLQQSLTQIRDCVDRWISEVESEVKMSFAEFLRELGEQVPQWDAKGKGSLGRLSRAFTRDGRVALSREIQQGYVSVLQREMQIFCTRTVDPFIRQKQTELLQRIEPLLQSYANTLEELRSELTGLPAVADHDYLQQALALSADRGRAPGEDPDIPLHLRAVPMMAFGAGAGAGAGGGFAAAASAGAVSLGVAMPPLGAAMAFGAALGALSAGFVAVFSVGKLRGKVAEDFAAHLVRTADASGQQYARNRAADLRGHWRGVADALADRLQELIVSVKRNIDGARVDEQEKVHRRNEISHHERSLTDIEDLIGAFLKPYVSEVPRD
ncbi:dynamin family protein [Streptomyces sp. SAJ15]|uniref:dynamin family protein n=1 Tax=Streptomyces sp. SAJ15 TaxID=2011095 RepID=UPI001184F25F|nr:dynamin family protein [Streptomyces sp. SAJ15]TVL91899.1 hypothetical protein CD790_14530 [Streptomyces sp. SAJ15]